jgi:cell division protein ZapA
MKRALEVEILGQKFTITSDAEEGYMLKVADYVDGKMQELAQSPKPVAKANVTMLAALNIAGYDYETGNRQLSALRQQIREDLNKPALSCWLGFTIAN